MHCIAPYHYNWELFGVKSQTSFTTELSGNVTRNRAIAGRMSRCRCRFRHISNFCNKYSYYTL